MPEYLSGPQQRKEAEVRTALIRELLRGIQTEIGAGMVLFAKSPEERAHNNACERANKIIQNYRDGFGLFQMTRPELAALTASTDPKTSATPSGGARHQQKAKS
jgi:hypothetical protein